MQNKEKIKKSRKLPDSKFNTKNILRYSGMGLQMGAIMLLGVWGGMKLDEKFGNTNNLFTAILTVFAVFVAVYFTIKDLIRNK
ncbi:MAG: AtpZ/AtpI family protein [Bacteroidia bacterium]|nr:AtpZ/AtpI family protein [Bacteroidia bacterium]MCZ2248579.1 AtpZ/AtpI family protein [Bacteroidia bacterium]